MSAAPNQGIGHFYIPEDQSIYLLSSKDAKKLKDWLFLCTQELTRLGYSDIELVGKGAFGFAFGGKNRHGDALVFKFTRINLPASVQAKLAEEADMLAQVDHPHIPALVIYQQIQQQSVMVMQRAPGIDLEAYSLRNGRISPKMAVQLMLQIVDIFSYLHQFTIHNQLKPIVHGDIKPSNLVWDATTEQVSLIDWGSSVFAQLDENRQPVGQSIMDLLSTDQQITNAKLGDVYFIGAEQLAGDLSSVNFDYQGLASTIYALCSAQGARFGKEVITANSLGLPKVCADILNGLLHDDPIQQQQAMRYLRDNQRYLQHLVFSTQYQPTHTSFIPCRLSANFLDIETVVYSSRKSFLREQGDLSEGQLAKIDDAQFERYYKQYLQGMGENEKAFIAAVSRLGKYPVVGGLAIRWQPDGILVDSNLNLYRNQQHTDKTLIAFEQSVNNIITLARAIHRNGVFKACLFDAKVTLHLERDDPKAAFVVPDSLNIPYTIANHSVDDLTSQQHSYFEDGDDPDEFLQLPEAILDLIEQLNTIHHSGCLIFEALPTHLKIHSFLQLFDSQQETIFAEILQKILHHVPTIEGLGISGFMKLPNKDTRQFAHAAHAPDDFYPRNIRASEI